MTLLYGPDGRPLPLTEDYAPTADPGLRGGWQYGGLPNGVYTPGGTTYLYGINRYQEQLKARSAYWVNPLLSGALEVSNSFLIGDNFGYGDLDDKAAQQALDDFWELNSMSDMLERFSVEFSLDGENASVLLDDPGANSPAELGFIDVMRGGLEIVGTRAHKVTALKATDSAGNLQLYDEERLVWTAFRSMYNDPRGWPAVMTAVDAALNYVNLINYRLRYHEFISRVTAVYYAFVNTQQADGGLASHKAKAAMYRTLPRTGGVLTLAMDPASGNHESLEVLSAKSGNGATAETDAKILLQMVGLAMGGLPTHYLGEGGGTTRTTADAMGEPARKGFLRRQAQLRSWLDRLMRLELNRRFGADRLYTLKNVTVSPDGLTRKVSRKRVPSRLLTFPWSFPSVDSYDLQGLALKVQTAARFGLASPQTLAGLLDLDASVESERMAAAGLTFGKGQVTPGTPDNPTDPNAETQPPGGAA